MGDQTSQRRDLVSQAADACKRLLGALHDLNNLIERKPSMGGFQAADFTGTDLAYLDVGTADLLFNRVGPAMIAAYKHQAFNDGDGFQLVVSLNAGRNLQILNQVAKTL